MLRRLVPEGRTIIETDDWAAGRDYEGSPIGLLVVLPGADRIKVAANWYPNLAPGAFVAMEPFSDDHKRRVVEKRLGYESIEDGWAVFYP